MNSAHRDTPPWQRLPVELASALRARTAATVGLVAEQLTASIPAFAELEDTKVTHDVRAAVEVALERFVDLIGTDEPALTRLSREVFVALGAAEAREDRGPDALLTALRIASRLLLRTSCETLAQVRPVSTDELIDLSDAVSAYTDELAAASTEGFALQLREQAGEGDRRRRQLAELLLRGGVPEPVVLPAAAGIGWRSLGDVVCIVVAPDQARAVRFRYGGDGVVLERERDAVLLLRNGPRSAREQLSEGLHGRGAVVAPTVGWSRVPEALRLAELTAELTGGAKGLLTAGAPVFVGDHLATLALRGEAGALAMLSARRLAPLSGLRDGHRERLLETLHSWLRHWGSRGDVAAQLFVHPQTVSYRIKHLRDLFGDDLDDATVRFELLLALADRSATRPASAPASAPAPDPKKTE
jgi:hypothetical protein